MSEHGPLFFVKPDGELIRMTPSAPSKEDDLQALIARHPDLIGDGDGALLLIEREHGIPDALDGHDRWSLDHLFVTRSATPVLVEVKRAVDTRLRREVVGQLLDYAANGVAFWPSGTIATRFESTCREDGIDPIEKLAGFLGPETDPVAFWAQVDANFRAGQVKLLFVADRIPGELARIVEFLNDQMRADVRAVELSYFQGPDGVLTLAPRIIGETERSRAQKYGGGAKPERMSNEAWFAENVAPLGSKTVEGARLLLDFMQSLGATSGVPSTRGSIFFQFQRADGKQVYPLLLLKNGSAQIGLGYAATCPALTSEQSRRDFFDRFSAVVGPLSTKFHPNGFPSFPVDRLTVAEVFDAFRKVTMDYVQACRAGTSGS
jgi:hypothetical protein